MYADDVCVTYHATDDNHDI